MRLHRDGHDHIGRFRRGERREDIAGEHIVLRPAGGVQLQPVHILHRGERVEAQIGVHLVAVIEHRCVVVYGVRRVALLLEVIADRLARPVLKHGVIGIFARAEIAYAHAGEHLKLRVHRAAAKHGHSEPSAGIILAQMRKYRHGVLLQLQPVKVRRIEERLELHQYDVGADAGLFFAARADFLDDLLHALLAVIVGLGDALIEQRARKAIGEAVLGIGGDQVVVMLRQYPRAGEEHRREEHHQRAHRHADRMAEADGIAACAQQADHDQRNQPHNAYDDEHHRREAQIVIGDALHRGDERQIDERERRRPEKEQYKIGDAQPEPHHRHDDIHKQPPRRQQREGVGHGDDEHVIQEHMRRGHDERKRLDHRMAAERLQHEIDNHAAQQHGQYRPAVEECVGQRAQRRAFAPRSVPPGLFFHGLSAGRASPFRRAPSPVQRFFMAIPCSSYYTDAL